MPFLSRRTFTKSLGAGSLLAACAGTPSPKPVAAPPTAGGTRRLERIGLITGTIQRALRDDFTGTIKKVAAIGYKELEMGPQRAMPEPDFRKMLDDLGLVAVAGGASITQLEDQLDETLEVSRVHGKRFVVCYWPWRDNGKNKTMEDWKRLGDTLNTVGARVKAAGFRFAYHNHDIEFVPTEGQIPFDTVLRGTDPAVVDMELDLYWISKGGQDPVAYFKKHPGRFPLVHVKDMDATLAQGRACPGRGTLDWRTIIAAGHEAGVKHFIVENEGIPDGIPCIEASYTALSALRF